MIEEKHLASRESSTSGELSGQRSNLYPQTSSAAQQSITKSIEQRIASLEEDMALINKHNPHLLGKQTIRTATTAGEEK